MAIPHRIAWADVDDSFSSTEDDYDGASAASLPDIHPEVEFLRESMQGRQFPLTIYLGNLPYDLDEPKQVSKFVALDGLPVTFLMQNGRVSGKATVVAQTRIEANKILDRHGQILCGRPVYMNLDGYFGRGKQHLKLLSKPVKGPWWLKKKAKKNKQRPVC